MKTPWIAALVLMLASAPQSNGQDLFARPAVLRIQIELPETTLDALRKNPKQYVKAIVREAGKVYTDVGVRMKSDIRTGDNKPMLVLKFDEFIDKQQFHNRKRIQLNSSKSDPSYLAEALSGEVFRAAGLPAAKVTFARVQLNGRDLGLYDVVEAANKEFLSDYFKDDKGNFYEGSNQDVVDRLENDNNDSADQADLKALAGAAMESDPAERWKKLSQVLDIDRFITYVAVEVLVNHHDGYSRDRNNFRIYHDPTSDKFVFIPHGTDGTFEDDSPLFQDWEGKVAIGVLTTPQGRQQYLARMSQLLTTVFKVDALRVRLSELSVLIRPAVAEHDPSAVRSFDARVSQMHDWIARRAGFLEQQIKAQPAIR